MGLFSDGHALLTFSLNTQSDTESQGITKSQNIRERVLGHMSQGDDGGGDSNNIVITSSLHLIKLLYESQPYAYASPASPPFDIL